jgi:DNA-binding transcriptional ArsR family regulator
MAVSPPKAAETRAMGEALTSSGSRTAAAPDSHPRGSRPSERSTEWLTLASPKQTFNHMVELTKAPLDAVFHALADGTRRTMLERLAQRPHSVGELAAPFEMSLAAASKHIQVLERAGLVRRDIQGCSLDAAPMHAGAEWLRHYEVFWTQRLDALEALLKHEPAPPPRRTKRKSP